MFTDLTALEWTSQWEMFLQLCCVAYCSASGKTNNKHRDSLQKVEPSSTSWNMSLQFARLNIVARQVSQASGNDAFQLAKLQEKFTNSALTHALNKMRGYV